jgi:capsular exopolysaccharide synthesis family protein
VTERADPLATIVVPLRRWWPVIVGAVVLAVALGWLTRPDPPTVVPGTGEVIEPGVAYRATHILVRGRVTPATENFALVGMLAQQGAVKAAVAEELGDRVETGAADAVSVEADPELGTLSITVVQPTAERASLVVSTYARAVIRHFDEQAAAARQERIDLATERLALIDERIQRLIGEQEDLQEGSLQARLNESELNVLVDQYGMLQGELRNLATSDVDGGASFETLQEPEPFEVAVGAGPAFFEVPTSPVLRFVLIALAGLVGGAALTIGIDRLDTRLRTRDDAEEASGLPVITEVPSVSWQERRHPGLAVRDDPVSPVAEAYRSLRLSVEYEPRWRLERTAPTGDETVATATRVVGEGSPQVLLVASPATAEGKSTVAANLAASLSEHGRQVLVVDCDFRRTTLPALLGAEARPGLRELGMLGQDSLSALIRPCSLPNVGVVPSGRPGRAPLWFPESGASLVEQARRVADIVIFDSGPLRVTSEAAALIPWVDSVILVTRAGRSRRADVTRATEQLARLRATVSGVVLLGAARASRTSTYYRSVRRATSEERADA